MNFDDILEIADNASFVHPEGKKVPAVVHSAVAKLSQSNNLMIEARFRVTGGPNAGKGQPMRQYLVLTQDSVKQQLSNLGFPWKNVEAFRGKGLDALEVGAKIAAAIVGRPCTIDIKQETYNDRLQNKVVWVNPPSSGSGTPSPSPTSTPAKTESAAPESEEAILRKKLEELEAAKAEAAAKPAAEAPSAPFGDDDDLPF